MNPGMGARTIFATAKEAGLFWEGARGGCAVFGYAKCNLKALAYVCIM